MFAWVRRRFYSSRKRWRIDPPRSAAGLLFYLFSFSWGVVKLYIFYFHCPINFQLYVMFNSRSSNLYHIFNRTFLFVWEHLFQNKFSKTFYFVLRIILLIQIIFSLEHFHLFKDTFMFLDFIVILELFSEQILFSKHIFLCIEQFNLIWYFNLFSIFYGIFYLF